MCCCHLLQKMFQGLENADCSWWAAGKYEISSFSDYVFTQYSWRCDETFVHLLLMWVFQESRAAFEDMNQSFENGAPRHKVVYEWNLVFFSQLFCYLFWFCLFLSFFSGGILGGRCKTEGWMDKMDLSQIVIKLVVIEHGLIDVCYNSSPMIYTLALSTTKVPPSLIAKLRNSWNCYQKYLWRYQYQK